jgi:hypothetical protein
MPRKIEYPGRTVELIYYNRDEKAEFDAWARSMERLPKLF